MEILKNLKKYIMKNMKNTISYEDAFDKVMKNIHRMPLIEVNLQEALGRVLGENVISDINMPPFDKSAMDGYACRREDLGQKLEVLEVIQAGIMPKKQVFANQCSKIMTGAPVPKGADCVIMVEYTEEKNGFMIAATNKTSNNICYKAEDIKKDDIVLKKGKIINPAEIAVLATAGYAKVKVSIKPRVGIIATGSELVDVAESAKDAKIRNSNSEQLAAQCIKLGADVTNYGIAEDTQGDIEKALQSVMLKNDLVILSGGVSMGDFDLVPGILKENGFNFLFESVAMQPGRPTIFGTHFDENIYCCGLPGNPVSTFIIFELLLKPFLYGMMGHSYKPIKIPLELEKEIKRKKSKRQSSIPIKIENGKVIPIEYHGSAHINAMTLADGLITMPIGVAEYAKGTMIEVMIL